MSVAGFQHPPPRSLPVHKHLHAAR